MNADDPICNADLEKALLDCLLTDPAELPGVRAILPVDGLYVDALRLWYAGMCTLVDSGAALDIELLIDHMARAGTLEDAGGASAAPGLYPYDTAAAGDIARQIAGYAAKRRMFNQTQPWAILAQDPAQDPASVAAKIRSGLDAIEAALPAGFTGAQTAAFPIHTIEEAEALTPARGLVGDILYEGAVSFLYADSGRWKSFLVASWGVHVGAGRKWQGRDVAQGDVLIVCSEGARGMGQRCAAVREHYGITDEVRVRIVGRAVDLTQPGEVAALLAQVQTLDFQPSLIIFDTLATSMSGDENGAEIASTVTKTARRISQACNDACVLIVHHSGYDASHMRGSSALRHNADLVIRLEGGTPNKRIEPGQPVRVVCDKPYKEAEPFADFCITAARKTWGINENGATVSSLVIVGTDAQPQNNGATPASPNRVHLLKTITAAQGLHASDLEHLFVETAPRTMTRSTLYEHLKTLKFSGQIQQRRDGAYISAAPASPGSPVRSDLRPVGPGNEVRSGPGGVIHPDARTCPDDADWTAS